MKALFVKAKLYVLAVPLILYFIGAASNQAVFAANQGRFPVRLNAARLYATAKRCPDMACIVLLSKYGMIDSRHSVMTDQTHLNWLADWIDLGGIYSPGDLLIQTADYLWQYAPFLWVCLMVSDSLKRKET